MLQTLGKVKYNKTKSCTKTHQLQGGIKSKNKQALYSKLLSSIREMIKDMEVGEKLPSERQLCIDYNVSRTTVRRAISDLELSGEVKRIQGSGTFVDRPSAVRHNLSDYYSFTEQTKRLGNVPVSIIIEYHIENANSTTAEMFDITEEDLIIKFIRLRKSNDIPMMLETTFLNYADFPEITMALLEKMPLYEIFEEVYQRKIFKVQESYSVSNLDKKQAEILEVPSTEPALKISRVSTDKDDKVIEFTLSLARGDKFNYQTTYFPE